MLSLDGILAVVGGGTLWVKIVARTEPRGVVYSLTLHELDGERIMGFDNAHGSDHRHSGHGVRRYAYRDAATLLEDFWAEVDRTLRERGLE